jgi:hypothetical protein
MIIEINEKNIIIKEDGGEKSFPYKNKFELVYWVMEEIFHFLSTEPTKEIKGE